MIIMYQMERMMLRMAELRPRIPTWARAEQMQICTPQKELWKYTDAPSRVATKKHKRIQAGEVF